MATGKASDFKIYEAEFYGGMYEAVSQFTGAFNAGSQNALRLVARDIRGLYEKESFFKLISSLVTRRDTTSVTGVTDLAMTQDELVSVKINRKIGPVAQTLDAWKKVGQDAGEMSFQLGKQIGQEKVKDMLNTGIIALDAALDGQSAIEYDATGLSTGTLTHTHLVSGLAKFGDQAGSVIAWVMHSKPYFDLVKQAIADKVFEVAGVTIMQGNVATLGRPTIVIDSPALWDANGSAADSYNVLGLTTDALVVTESEEETIASEMVTGLENLVMRIQGEYAFNIGVKGFKWDVSNGGANPTDTTLGTTTNWDKAVGEDKHLAGVRVIVD